MSCYNIIAIRLESRTQNANNLQEILTRSGCNIKVRLGLHEVSDDYCANDGVIILQVCGKDEEIQQLLDNLNHMDGATAKLIRL
ncbi:MAG: hypothetical protein GX222_05835 [Ruminococcaceae bacterium]|nr:hypothetical protein [Oscillospiraceae bacterium]